MSTPNTPVPSKYHCPLQEPFSLEKWLEKYKMSLRYPTRKERHSQTIIETNQRYSKATLRGLLLVKKMVVNYTIMNKLGNHESIKI